MEELYQKLRFSIKDGQQALAISTHEADNIKIDEFENYLLSISVINYDINQIDTVVHNAKDEPEIIGPVFEKFNISKSSPIKIKTDGFTASLMISSGNEKLLETITYEDVIFRLRKEKVLYKYIKTAVIQELLETKQWNKEVEIAVATPAINGDDAKIEYKIDLEHFGTPKELEDGRADFKDIGKVIIVAAKQILAEKTPLTLGVDGENLFGAKIPAVAGEDIALPAGKNTSISDDAMKLFANVDGYVYTSDLGINIGETFMVDGDLDYNTGNIEYNSDVFIKKNVLPDFKVISENGDIYIEGEVDNAYIEAKNGNVQIKKGVFGDHTVIIGKEIKLDFIQGEADVTGEDIIIKKFSYGAKVKAINSIKVSSVMGGYLECQKEIITSEIGSESNTETVVKIYNDRVEEIAVLLEKGESDKKKLEASFAEVTQQIQMIKRKLAVKKDISDADKKQATEKIGQYNKIKTWIEKIDVNIQKLRDERFTILSASEAKIEIQSKLYPNVKIQFFNNHYVSKELFSGSKTIDINTLKL